MTPVFTALFIVLTAFTFPAYSWEDYPPDSVRKKSKNTTLRLTARAHTAGFFYFGGKIAEYNPAFDLHINLETPMFGYTFFKAADLGDIHSSFNFALAGIYKHIPVGKKLKFTPQMIVLIEQPHRVIDEGSDLGFTFMTTYKLTKELTIEETFILFNIVFETSYLDIINRIRLLYAKKHLDIFLMAWNNNNWVDAEKHYTGALSIAYNRVKISEHLQIGAGVMAAGTYLSSDRTEVPERKGIVFTLTATVI